MAIARQGLKVKVIGKGHGLARIATRWVWPRSLLLILDRGMGAPRKGQGGSRGVTWPPLDFDINFPHIITVAPTVEIQMHFWKGSKFAGSVGHPMTKMLSASGGLRPFAPLTPWPGALPLDPAGGSAPDPRYRLVIFDATLDSSAFVGRFHLRNKIILHVSVRFVDTVRIVCGAGSVYCNDRMSVRRSVPSIDSSSGVRLVCCWVRAPAADFDGQLQAPRVSANVGNVLLRAEWWGSTQASCAYFCLFLELILLPYLLHCVDSGITYHIPL